MSKLEHLNPQRVFHYFEELSAIPHGSENMEAISAYCMEFAEKQGLEARRDSANNVIIYKKAAKGYEEAAPMILQGHLDMVCQKTPESTIDFLKDGLDLYVEGDFVKARGTTLGADNGIAVAMVLAILEDKNLPAPALEAVFTTDEEIGMIGASQLDFSLLKGRKMINLDAEEDDSVTVSCAGGSDFQVRIPVERTAMVGQKVTVTLQGLQGGHSGVEIHKGRINAARLGRMLLELEGAEVLSYNSGDKANAIPNRCVAEFCVVHREAFLAAIKGLEQPLAKAAEKEPALSLQVEEGAEGNYSVFASATKEALAAALQNPPDGMVTMSQEIDGLVETSLNLGITATEEKDILLHFALRSNKEAGLTALEEELKTHFPAQWINTFGRYPSWEFKSDSTLQELYKETYRSVMGKEPKVEAIHAGLECGVFAAGLPGLDCIAIGPQLYDVHTVQERLSISSLERVYRILLQLLKASR